MFKISSIVIHHFSALSSHSLFPRPLSPSTYRFSWYALWCEAYEIWGQCEAMLLMSRHALSVLLLVCCLILCRFCSFVFQSHSLTHSHFFAQSLFRTSTHSLDHSQSLSSPFTSPGKHPHVYQSTMSFTVLFIPSSFSFCLPVRFSVPVVPLARALFSHVSVSAPHPLDSPHFTQSPHSFTR